MSQSIVILTVDLGFGHRSAARALASAFQIIGQDTYDVHIVNPLENPSIPGLLKQLEEHYNTAVTEEPVLYKLAYTATDDPFVARVLQDVTTTFLNTAMMEIIQTYAPVAIVTTYSAFTQAALKAVRDYSATIPVDVIVTDLVDVHATWFHKDASLTFVPTGHVYKQALDNGIDKSKVQLTGLPVHPQYAMISQSKEALRDKLGWDQKPITTLIVGSARTKGTAPIAKLLDRSGLPLQLAVVSGKNMETEEELEQTQWQRKTHIYGLADNMYELMRAADFIICKAGGLIVAESLASALPLILSEALPGQEIGNVRYVVDSGAGVWSPGHIGALTAAFSWLARDATALEYHRKMAQQIGKPRAALDIAEHVIRQIKNIS